MNDGYETVLMREGGAMGALIRDHDWSATPFGPTAEWGRPLRAVLAMCLTSPAISALFWGPDFRLLYNDAYAPALAERHPGALGRPVAQVWSEIWDILGAQLIAVMETGQGLVTENQLLMIERRGRREETFWSYSLVPVRDEGAAVAGIYVTASDRTAQVQAERRLASATARQRRLFECAPGFIAILQGPEHVFEFANEAYVRLVGERELLGMKVRSALPDIEGQGFFELLDEVYASGRRHLADRVPIRLRRSSEVVEERFVAFIYEPTRDEAGRVTGIFVEGHDVTETHLTQEALRESEEFNRRILASSTDCIKVLDLDGRLVFMSEGGRLAMEVADLDAIVGKPWPDLWPGQGHRDALDAVAAARAGQPKYFQALAITAAGTPKWWDVRVTPILDAAGRPERILCVSRDVTATRTAEESLRDLNATLEQRIEDRTRERDRAWKNSRDLQAVVGADGIFHAVNGSWTTVLGWHPDEVVGRCHLDFNHPDDIQASTAARDRAATEGLPVYENRVLHKDGTYRWISWVAAPEDGVIYASGRNVTAEREAAATLEAAQDQLRQAQKLEAVGQLTGGVAHDFNNLLTVIKSSTDLLKRPDLPEERRARYIAAISDTVARAAKLTGQLLAFARRQALKPEVFDVGRSVGTVGDMVSSLTGSRIEIVTNLPDVPCFVRADPSQFDTALVNLAVNARDAMDGQGRLTIRVSVVDGIPAVRRHRLVSGSYVAVSISDTGSGIPPDLVERIFEPFFTTKRVGQGTGLGLSQVFGFTKQSDGEIRVESAVGEGTTFTLYLPAVAGDVRVADTSEPDTLVDGHGTCVLMVEDNMEVGAFAAQTLAELGYTTVWSVNAEEALVELEKDTQRFDVVFSDVVMPGMGGVELGHAVRKLHPDLPVVLTSGYSHVLAQNGTYGFELLHKPYSVEQLSRILRKAASWKRRRPLTTE
ncbi:PAS domain-containing protein [Methylobacterium sp. J-048]|uniref:PAS domain-containing protein n=1 Tax=Methylobacterium sp. J-048 TaxID=2836635 RepID=UPI001FB98AB9|nr:PAS domain-containing protein [Methylobacterium sp. J-048]MCJ2059498.1 PAS domain-containing protein [Methylobacterium sp. J-048]